MKNIPFLLIAFIALVSLDACKKPEKKILGAWIANKVTIDGVDKTADYTKNNYKESYGESDVYSFSGDPDGYSGEGNYIWSTDTKIKRSAVTNQPSMEITITTLSRKKLVYTCTISGKAATFEFQKMN